MQTPACARPHACLSCFPDEESAGAALISARSLQSQVALGGVEPEQRQTSNCVLEDVSISTGSVHAWGTCACKQWTASDAPSRPWVCRNGKLICNCDGCSSDTDSAVRCDGAMAHIRSRCWMHGLLLRCFCGSLKNHRAVKDVKLLVFRAVKDVKLLVFSAVLPAQALGCWRQRSPLLDRP